MKLVVVVPVLELLEVDGERGAVLAVDHVDPSDSVCRQIDPGCGVDDPMAIAHLQVPRAGRNLGEGDCPGA